MEVRTVLGWTVVTCSFCGTVVESDDPPITWTVGDRERQAALVLRRLLAQHLRAMESKLDSEWW